MTSFLGEPHILISVLKVFVSPVQMLVTSIPVWIRTFPSTAFDQATDEECRMPIEDLHYLFQPKLTPTHLPGE